MKKKLRLLITNDDGIDAPGLAVLIDIAGKLASEVDIWVVAPQMEQSGTSQSFTMKNPVRIRALKEQRFAVSCTPSDCVILSLQHIMKDCPPDFVLSGVNAGINIGHDINLSGTLGAAFTSLMYGIPSIGISMKRPPQGNVRWATARAILPHMMADLMTRGWKNNHCLSINIPNLPPEEIAGSCWTQPAHGIMPPFEIKEGTDLRKKEFFWVYPHHHPETGAAPDSDAVALQRGFVSISVLALTHNFVMPASAPPSLSKSLPLK
jgi:5'-nucleotidase